MQRWQINVYRSVFFQVLHNAFQAFEQSFRTRCEIRPSRVAGNGAPRHPSTQKTRAGDPAPPAAQAPGPPLRVFQRSGVEEPLTSIELLAPSRGPRRAFSSAVGW
jgi:hypothetical protein